MLALVLVHGLGPRLGLEDALVAVTLQLGLEEVEKLLRLDLLKGDDVGAEKKQK